MHTLPTAVMNYAKDTRAPVVNVSSGNLGRVPVPYL